MARIDDSRLAEPVHRSEVMSSADSYRIPGAPQAGEGVIPPSLPVPPLLEAVPETRQDTLPENELDVERDVERDVKRDVEQVVRFEASPELPTIEQTAASAPEGLAATPTAEPLLESPPDPLAPALASTLAPALAPALAEPPSEAASDTPSAASRALHRLTWCMTILGFLLVCVSGLPLLVEEIQYRLERGRQRARVEIATASLGNMHLSELSRAYQMVSQRVGPSVVHINVVDASGEPSEEEEAADSATEEPFRRPRRRAESGQGSGVIIDHEGHIVTNRHVIEDARRIEVVLSDGRRRPARVVGVDRPTDIAVLKVDASGLLPAEWGDSESLEVGGLVWAVGSPFGLERSITFGILSAKNRAGVAGTPFQNLMQTDAAVNPGNSGGPLVDTTGRVIGINTAIVGPSYQGVSFAIPSSVAERVFQDLKSQGAVARGWLGIEPRPIDDELALMHNLTERRGAFVHRLADGPFGEQSPARMAGIQAGDVIRRWNGHDIDSSATLIARVSQTKVGDTVPVELLRAGQSLRLDVTVGQRPAAID